MTNESSGNLSLVTAFAIVASLLLACLPLSSQTPPQLTGIEWRDIEAEEGAKKFFAMLKAGATKDALPVAQRLIDRDLEPKIRTLEDGKKVGLWNLIPDQFVDGLYISPSYFISRMIAGQDAEIRQAYEELFGKTAARSLQSAKKFGSAEALQRLSVRFPGTTAGQEALAMLGHDALERGDFASSARFFGDFLDFRWYDDDPSAQLAEFIAKEQAGERSRLTSSALGKSVMWAGRSTSLQAVVDACTRRDFAVPVLSGLAQSHAGQRPSDLSGRLKEKWAFPLEIPSEEFDAHVHPIIVGRYIVFHTRKRLVILNAKDGTLHREVKFGDEAEDSAIPHMDGVAWDDLRGAASNSTYYFVTAFESADGKSVLNRLHAIDVPTGKILWQQDGDGLTPDSPPLYFDAAPLVQDDTLYVSATDRGSNISSYVLAMSTKTGSLKWLTRTGSGVALQFRFKNGDFETSRSWLGALPLCASGGFILICDNLGNIAWLEADTGRPRMLYHYERRRMNEADRLSGGALSRGWHQNPILVSGERFLIAADDSDVLQAFFLRPPQDPTRRKNGFHFMKAATLGRQKMSQLLSFDGESAVLGGFDELEKMPFVARIPIFVTDKPARPWTFPIGSSLVGRGFSGQKKVYVSSHKYVYSIDLQSGESAGVLVGREADGALMNGHVLIIPNGMIVAARKAVLLYTAAK